MPFAPADLYSATLSDNQYNEQRPGQSTTSSPTLNINSNQFFSLALLLFIATGIQAYFAPSSSSSMSSLHDANAALSMTRYAVHAFSDILSPLMLLSCSVAATGTLVRGLELVVKAAAFKGR